MIYIEHDTHKPIFARRKDRKRIHLRAQPVMEDATGRIAALAVAIAGVLLLALIASPMTTGWLMELLPGAGAETLTVTASELNGRATPSKKGHVEAIFMRGDELDAVSIDGEWVEVIGGETGTVWCHADYLTESEPYKATNTSGGAVNVRSEPDGDRVGKVSAGESVTIERRVMGWGYTGSGWVMLKYFSEE